MALTSRQVDRIVGAVFHTRGKLHTANVEITPSVVRAFVVGFVNNGRVKVAFRTVVTKIRSLISLLSRAPRIWERFKALIGVEKLTELPSKIKEWAKKGYQALRNAVDRAFSKWPLKLYTLSKGKLAGLNDLLAKLVDQFPALNKMLNEKVRPSVDYFEKLIRRYIPVVGTAILVAIYIWIWWNVTEFEWDLKALTDVITGKLTLSELLLSLPGSIIGLMMNSLGFGMFTLLPYTIVAKATFLLAYHIIEWSETKGFSANKGKLIHLFGPSQEVSALV